jgi:hypothetical protein
MVANKTESCAKPMKGIKRWLFVVKKSIDVMEVTSYVMEITLIFDDICFDL